MRATTRALVVDDHPLVCAALQAALQAARPGLEVERADSLSAMELAAARDSEAALIVLDLMLPDATGFSGLFRARRLFPGAHVVIVSGRCDARIVRTAEALGARGFLSKTTGLGEMRAAFVAVLDGGTHFDPPDDTAEPEDAPSLSALRERLDGLTARQLEILLALGEGHATKVVAADLNLSEAAVKAQLTGLFRVFGVTNRAQLLLMTKDLTRLESRA